MKPHVLIVSTRPCWPVENGATRASMSFLQDLEPLCKEIHYLAPRFTSPIIKSHDSPTFFTQETWDEKNAALTIAKQLVSRPLPVTKYETPQLKERLRVALEKKPDLIIVEQTHLLGIVCDLVGSESSKKVWFRAHNDEALLFQKLHPWLFWEAIRFKKFQKHYFEKIAGILSLSLREHEYWKHNGFPSFYYPISLLAHDAGHGMKNPKKKFGMLADFRYGPNQEMLQWWNKNFTDKTSWLVCGPQSLFGAIADVEEFYHDIRLVVVPVITGTGVSTKIIESASFGTPVLTTPEGARGLPDGNELENFGIFVRDRKDFDQEIKRFQDLKDDQWLIYQERIMSWFKKNFDRNQLSRRLKIILRIQE